MPHRRWSSFAAHEVGSSLGAFLQREFNVTPLTVTPRQLGPADIHHQVQVGPIDCDYYSGLNLKPATGGTIDNNTLVSAAVATDPRLEAGKPSSKAALAVTVTSMLQSHPQAEGSSQRLGAGMESSKSESPSVLEQISPIPSAASGGRKRHQPWAISASTRSIDARRQSGSFVDTRAFTGRSITSNGFATDTSRLVGGHDKPPAAKRVRVSPQPEAWQKVSSPTTILPPVTPGRVDALRSDDLQHEATASGSLTRLASWEMLDCFLRSSTACSPTLKGDDSLPQQLPGVMLSKVPSRLSNTWPSPLKQQATLPALVASSRLGASKLPCTPVGSHLSNEGSHVERRSVSPPLADAVRSIFPQYLAADVATPSAATSPAGSRSHLRMPILEHILMESNAGRVNLGVPAPKAGYEGGHGGGDGVKHAASGALWDATVAELDLTLRL